MTRSMRNILLLGLVLVCANIGAVAADEKQMPHKPATHWKAIETATGMCNLDGTLRLSFSLGENINLKHLGVRWRLEHRVERNALGQAQSAWHFVGLQSCLVPSGREHFRWQPLAGGNVKFERASIGRALSEAGSRQWRIRESAPGAHEIRSSDGRVWSYLKGILTSAEHPAIGEVRFVSQGVRVREIRRGDASDQAAPELRADYDDAGRLTSLVLGEQESQAFEWNSAGQLITWRRGENESVEFAYRDDLLAGIKETGKPLRKFAWAENPGHERGDSRWRVPVHLTSADTEVYSYDLTSKGYILRRYEKETNVETITIFNPRRRRIEQRTNGETFIVTFRRGAGGVGALEKIENSAGEILEQYRYDERDQLIGVTRKGEPERVLRYDETGRLMAVEESHDL